MSTASRGVFDPGQRGRRSSEPFAPQRPDLRLRDARMAGEQVGERGRRELAVVLDQPVARILPVGDQPGLEGDLRQPVLEAEVAAEDAQRLGRRHDLHHAPGEVDAAVGQLSELVLVVEAHGGGAGPVEPRPLDVEARAVGLLALQPGVEDVLAPGGEDLLLEALECRLAEGPPGEPGRVLHVPHPVVMIEVLAGDLLVGAEMAVLAEARDRARTARGVQRDQRIEIGEAQLPAALPGRAHFGRQIDVLAAPPPDLAESPPLLALHGSCSR